MPKNDIHEVIDSYKKASRKHIYTILSELEEINKYNSSEQVKKSLAKIDKTMKLLTKRLEGIKEMTN